VPNIESIPEVYYQPLWPYQHEYDNLPLSNILFRQTIINSSLDLNNQRTNEAAGSAGTVGNRLDQSLTDSGALKVSAVDNVDHNIAFHEDGSRVISGESIAFVRMLEEERDKLALIASEATNLSIRFETIGPSETPVTFNEGILPFADSATITWRLDDGDVKADTTFPTSAVHQHVYDVEPVPQNPLSPDYVNYKTTSLSTAFTNGSLRVHINGVRLSESDGIYVPGPTPSSDYTLITYTPDAAAGTFALSTAITADDVIRIDFDIAMA